MLFIPLCSYRFPSGLIVHFPSAWGLPFTFHIVQICWWWMISLSFLYACKSLYLSFIIDSFFFLLGIEFQIDSFFLEYIKMLFYWLLACTISDKRFVVILIFLLYILWVLWLFLKFLFFTGFKQFEYGSFLQVSCVWSLLSLGLQVCSFH